MNRIYGLFYVLFIIWTLKIKVSKNIRNRLRGEALDI